MSLKKENKIKLFLIIFLPLFSWIFLSIVFFESKQKFNELALGKISVTVTNYINNKKIVCTSLEGLNECLSYLKEKKFRRFFLWIGNSQLNAVNQGDLINTKIASHRVSEYFYNKDVGVITFAAPNLSFQEYFVVINYLKKKIHFDGMVLSLVFDDTREDGVRESLAIQKEDKINRNIKKTLQERTETQIILYLDKYLKWEDIRSAAQGNVYQFLYLSRNFIFNINPTSVRKTIKPIFDKNMLSLEKILADAKEKNIKTVIYIAPLRNDIKTPYKNNEYLFFKESAKKISKKFSSNFYNLENIVPAHLWGEKAGTKIGVHREVDFMHFKESGHAILAKNIIAILDELF